MSNSIFYKTQYILYNIQYISLIHVIFDITYILYKQCIKITFFFCTSENVNKFLNKTIDAINRSLVHLFRFTNLLKFLF